MIKPLKSYLLLLSGILVLNACDNKDPEPTNEEELITTVKATFAPVGGGAAITATWKDLDGSGGNAPTVSSITLTKNTTYNVTLEILNEQANPTEDLTKEILSEAEAHQFFFQTTNNIGQITYDDTDKNGKPVGVKSKFATSSAAGTGTWKVILRHQPDKTATGVATGDIANAKGETDIETTPPFSITIQ